MRFLTAYFAAQPNKEVTLLCSKRMQQRPIAKLVNALQSLNAEICYLQEPNYPPILIKGKEIAGKNISIKASESSQFITALMLIAPFTKNGLTIELLGSIASIDYIKMTALIMEQFGLKVITNNNFITIPNQNKSAVISEFTVESDWSSAAFWYLTCCLNNQIAIKLNAISSNSIQGDNRTIAIFEKLGITSTKYQNNLIIQKNMKANNNCKFNLSNCIDLAPALCVACAALNINAIITGLENLIIKESNRLLAIVTELKKLGFKVNSNSNTIFIYQTQSINFEKKIVINTYNDHRIAMAFAPLAIQFNNLILNDVSVVTKSYPHFFADLEKVGISAISL
jgi:3-phosphoshikimate 1-carboxyvinyltransferase